jgi:hypothetical protein
MFPVRDIRIVCEIASCTPSAEIRFVREFDGRRWSATVSGSGEVELKSEPSEETPVSSDDSDTERAVTDQSKLARPLTAGTQLAFAVRDGQVYLSEDGRLRSVLVAGPQDIETWRRNWGAVAKTLVTDGAETVGLRTRRGRVAIEVSGGRVEISRIQLYRDVYYLTPEELDAKYGHMGIPLEFHPCRLAPDEFYVLGDNSEQSKDSRFWGTVPRENILGSVECIYWPPARWRQLR